MPRWPLRHWARLKSPLLMPALLALCLGAAVIWLSLAEKARIAVALPSALRPGPQVDAAALAADLHALRGPGMVIRPAGSFSASTTQEFLAARFRQIGLVPFEGKYITKFAYYTTDKAGLVIPGRRAYTDYESTANVVGFVRGTSYPARYVVVSARLDSGWRSDEAEGNDSGLATLLAIAAYLHHHPPLHTFIFAAFDGSAHDQAGADYFLDVPPVPPAHIGVNLNLDVVGGQNAAMLVLGGSYQTPSLAPLVRAAAASSPAQVQMGHDRPRWRAGIVADWTGLSGQAAFHDRGFPFLYATVANRYDGTDAYRQFDPGCCVDAANFLLALTQQLDTGFDTIRNAK